MASLLDRTAIRFKDVSNGEPIKAIDKGISHLFGKDQTKQS